MLSFDCYYHNISPPPAPEARIIKVMKDEANHAPKVKPAGVGQATPADQAYAAALLERLSKSKFRSSFSLRPADRDYFIKKGRATICRHAHELLAARVGVANPPKDGKQTPYRGHPVFTAQHATATCCRGCIAKWHGIPKGRPLTPAELDRLVTLIMAWLDEQMAR